MNWLPAWVKRRRVLAGTIAFLVTAVVAIPTVIAGAWAFWSTEPFALVLGRLLGGSTLLGVIFAVLASALLLGCAALLFTLIGVGLRQSDAPPDREGSANVDESLAFNYVLDRAFDGLTYKYLVSVTNQGPTDSFVAQATSASGIGAMFGATPGFPVLPSVVKWQGSSNDKMEIPGGQTRHLELLRFQHAKADDRTLGLPTATLVPPSGESDIFTLSQELTGVVTDKIRVWFEVQSLSSARTHKRIATVIVAVAGPNVHYFCGMQQEDE